MKITHTFTTEPGPSANRRKTGNTHQISNHTLALVTSSAFGAAVRHHPNTCAQTIVVSTMPLADTKSTDNFVRPVPAMALSNTNSASPHTLRSNCSKSKRTAPSHQTYSIAPRKRGSLKGRRLCSFACPRPELSTSAAKRSTHTKSGTWQTRISASRKGLPHFLELTRFCQSGASPRAPSKPQTILRSLKAMSSTVGFTQSRIHSSLVRGPKLTLAGSGFSSSWLHVGSAIMKAARAQPASGFLRMTKAKSTFSANCFAETVPSNLRRKGRTQRGSCSMKVFRERGVSVAASTKSCSNMLPDRMPHSNGLTAVAVAWPWLGLLSLARSRNGSNKFTAPVLKARWSADSPSRLFVIAALFSSKCATTPSLPPFPSAQTQACKAS
mmetsp:Transcript_99472/g.287116  ORF Transcript_99472/g.287116 Transcript_99472/m.287116 type:complete len:383 (+) Transcript_99472:1087-2235(+)